VAQQAGTILSTLMRSERGMPPSGTCQRSSTLRI
jgi:hypothetical protein